MRHHHHYHTPYHDGTFNHNHDGSDDHNHYASLYNNDRSTSYYHLDAICVDDDCPYRLHDDPDIVHIDDRDLVDYFNGPGYP